MSLLESKNIVVLGVIAFLVMSFWGLSAMQMDKDGKMIHCPFMDHSASFCQMSLGEHINQWQQMFTIVKEKSLFLFSMSLLILLFSILFTITLRTYYQLKFQSLRNYLYRHKPEIKLFNRMLLAFSDGIIHSKIYA